MIKRISISLLIAFSSSVFAAGEENKNTANIIVQGANKELLENINNMLPTRKPKCNADNDEIADFQDTLERYLQKAAKGVGYYNAQFKINAHKVKNCWSLQVNVTTGAVVHVQRVDVKITGAGKQEKQFQEILAKPMYQTGEPLRQNKYTDYKTNLINVASALGYFDAEFTEHQILVNPNNHTANIVLHMDTGERYRYGKITLKQDVLDKKHLKRFVQIKEGEAYDSNQLSEQQIYLQTTGYYADVIIHSKKDKKADHKIPIEIELDPKKRTAYEFKLGYGTDTGFRGSAKMNRRWVNGRGHKLQHEIKLSEYASSIESRYTVPLRHPQTENIFYNIKFAEEHKNDIKSKSSELGAQYSHKNGGGFQQTAFIKYLKDSTEIANEDKFFTRYLLFGARAERTQRDDPVFPHKGERLALDIQAASNSLLSSQNVFKIDVNTKFLRPLGSGKLVYRLNAGSVIAQDFNRLPESLRYFAGGRDSVRGYGYETLGERNADGKVIGGKNILTGSIEYDHPISQSWGAAAFVDVGNAFHDWRDYSLKAGAGVGARWKSPVGSVSIDLAWPKDNLSNPHLHLSIGPEL